MAKLMEDQAQKFEIYIYQGKYFHGFLFSALTKEIFDRTDICVYLVFSDTLDDLDDTLNCPWRKNIFDSIDNEVDSMRALLMSFEYSYDLLGEEQGKKILVLLEQSLSNLENNIKKLSK